MSSQEIFTVTSKTTSIPINNDLIQTLGGELKELSVNEAPPQKEDTMVEVFRNDFGQLFEYNNLIQKRGYDILPPIKEIVPSILEIFRLQPTRQSLRITFSFTIYDNGDVSLDTYAIDNMFFFCEILSTNSAGPVRPKLSNAYEFHYVQFMKTFENALENGHNILMSMDLDGNISSYIFKELRTTYKWLTLPENQNHFDEMDGNCLILTKSILADMTGKTAMQIMSHNFVLGDENIPAVILICRKIVDLNRSKCKELWGEMFFEKTNDDENENGYFSQKTGGYY